MKLILTQPDNSLNPRLEIVLPWDFDTRLEIKMEKQPDAIEKLLPSNNVEIPRQQFIELVRDIYRRSNKIETIKFIRMLLNLGLKDAKELVEEITGDK